jgi:hypothetical protein
LGCAGELDFGSSSGEQRIAGLLLQFPLILLAMPVLIGLAGRT